MPMHTMQAEQGNGNIKFERPDDARYYPFTPLNEEIPTYFNTQVCEYAFNPRCICFHGYPTVEQNLIDKDRISVSFNRYINHA